MLAALKRWRNARHLIEADATVLIEHHGDNSYHIARDVARNSGQSGDRLTQRHWGKVAVRIAGKIGHVIGEKVADRYEADDGNAASSMKTRIRK